MNNTVGNILYVLKSINYNDKVLDSLVGDNKLNYKEETFNIYHNTEAKKDNFLNYGTENHEEEKENVKDEDYIDIE